MLHNGVTRYVPQLARLTIYFCQRKKDGDIVRDYIRNDLSDFARRNPCLSATEMPSALHSVRAMFARFLAGTSIYVVPKLDVSPYLVAEYLNGRTASMPVGRLTAEELRQWMDHVRTRSGRRIAKFDAWTHTQHPSIQVGHFLLQKRRS